MASNYACQFITFRDLTAQPTDTNVTATNCKTADAQAATYFPPLSLPNGIYEVIFGNATLTNGVSGWAVSQAFTVSGGVLTGSATAPVTVVTPTALDLNAGTLTLDPRSLPADASYACQLVALHRIDSQDAYGLNVTNCQDAFAQATTYFIPASVPDGTYVLTFPDAFPGNYVSQPFTITGGVAVISPLTPQVISFTAPGAGTYGGQAALSATGGGSGNPVVFTVDPSATPGACAVSGADGTTLSYTGTGSCVLDASQAGGNGYAAAQVQRAITVSPAPLAVTASSPTMTQGGTVPAITASYSGFVNGDGPASLTTQPSCSTAATRTSPPGSYPASCSGAEDPDYAITYAPGTVTVVPPPCPPGTTANYRWHYSANGSSGSWSGTKTASCPGPLTLGPQAMEGDLKVTPGTTLQAGYDLTIPGNNGTRTLTLTNPQVTFTVHCLSGATPTAPTFTVTMPSATYTITGAAWYPSGDQSSPLTYQGTATVPDLCADGQLRLDKGGTFAATLS